MADLDALEQRKRELELQRDIRKLERMNAVDNALVSAKEKAPGAGRLVGKVLLWAVGAVIALWLVSWVLYGLGVYRPA